jgi:hypothetical protein
MRRLHVLVLAVALVLLAGPALAEKPTIGKPCVNCHKAQKDVLRGKFHSASQKAQTLQMQVGRHVWLVRFDQATQVVGAPEVKKIPRKKEIAVHYQMRQGEVYAKRIILKPPAKVPEEKLIKTDAVLRLVQGKGGEYVLLDARPPRRYHEGHIPTAKSMPLAAFQKLKDKLLPRDKNTLVVFYCGGVT